MKTLCMVLIHATLMIGAPVLAHAGRYSCPPAVVGETGYYRCSLANNTEARDVRFTIYSQDGAVVAGPTIINVAANGSAGVLHSGGIELDENHCEIEFMGNKKGTSANMVAEHYIGEGVAGAACR